MDQVADDLAGDYCRQREHTGEKVLGTSDSQVCKLVVLEEEYERF